MNESILAYKAYHRLQEYIHKELEDYFWEENRGWGDSYTKEWADRVCNLDDELIPVLEWLEKKFE